MQKAIVYIYQSLKDYADSKCAVVVKGVTEVAATKAGGYVFFTGEEQHAFPANIIFVVVKE